MLDREPSHWDHSVMEDQYVPYAPDFTPATLGKEVGEEEVLPRLLRAASAAVDYDELVEEIIRFGLGHIAANKEEAARRRDQRDMASHVVQGMRGYGLLDPNSDGIELTPFGRSLIEVGEYERDKMFALHILTRCNGMRLVDEIIKHELRDETPYLESLSQALDRHRTSKSISTMKAWLSRAGVMDPKAYRVNRVALEELLGGESERLLGLGREQLEFLLAARVLEAQSGDDVMTAPDVATIAETRAPDITIRRKSLSQFIDRLAEEGWVQRAKIRAGAGGGQVAFRLTPDAITLTEEQLRGLLAQLDEGFFLPNLKPLSELQQLLATDPPDVGALGEEFAVHICLMLGLRVVDWRTRAPASEIDLVAERSASFSYQRWAVQVKATKGKVSNAHVDRELGAALGSGVTHVLFVAPRSGITEPAVSVVRQANRLAPFHVFYLTKEAFEPEPHAPTLFAHLAVQQRDIEKLKRYEIERRARPFMSED